jgi:hypothetical protein
MSLNSALTSAVPSLKICRALTLMEFLLVLKYNRRGKYNNPHWEVEVGK